LEEVKAIDSNIEKEIEKRRDLRDLFTITID
jgi:exoribonuclease R